MNDALPARLQVRGAIEDDFAAITAIYAHHVLTGTATFEIDPPHSAEMARRWRDVTQRGLPYLVATEGADVVGYAYAGPYRPRPAYRFTAEDSIYVRNDVCGRGIGRTLLAALIEACERSSIRQMIAVIGDSANGASISVHAKFGFVHAGLLTSVGYKLGRWLDVVLMQRFIGDGDTTSPIATASNFSEAS